LPERPPLLNRQRDGFEPSLFDTPAEARRLLVRVEKAEGPWLDPKFREEATRSGAADAVVTFPADLRRQIERKEEPQIDAVYDTADGRSQLTYLRLDNVLDRWKERIVAERLKRDGLPPTYTAPVKVKPVDVATEAELGSSVWAKLFPFLLVM